MFGQGQQPRRWGRAVVESVHLCLAAELWELGEVCHFDESASAVLGGAARMAGGYGVLDTKTVRVLFWGGCLELLRSEASGCGGLEAELLLYVCVVLFPCF